MISEKETVSGLFLPTEMPSKDPRQAAFFSGWEDGQPNSFINLIYESEGVTGFFNSNEPPPKASPRYFESEFTQEMAPNGGDKYLMVAGYCQTASCFIHYTLFKTDIKIQPGMKLSYWIYDSSYSNTTFAIDGRFDNGTTIRDFKKGGNFLKDQNGIRIHPANQGFYEPRIWRYIEVDLSPAAGLTLDYIMVSYHAAIINHNPTLGQIRAYFDNLYIGP